MLCFGSVYVGACVCVLVVQVHTLQHTDVDIYILRCYSHTVQYIIRFSLSASSLVLNNHRNTRRSTVPSHNMEGDFHAIVIAYVKASITRAAARHL